MIPKLTLLIAGALSVFSGFAQQGSAARAPLNLLHLKTTANGWQLAAYSRHTDVQLPTFVVTDTVSFVWNPVAAGAAEPGQSRELILEETGYDSAARMMPVWGPSVGEVYVRSYNAAGQVDTVRVFEQWGGSVDLLEAYTFEYLGSGKLARRERAYISNGTDWNFTDRVDYTYNGDGTVDSINDSGYDAPVQAWVTRNTRAHSYDASGRLVSRISKGWRDVEQIFTYSGTATVPYTMTESYGNATGYMPTWKYVYSYNANGDLREEVQLGWNGSAFINRRRTTIRFNADNLMTFRYTESWKNGWEQGAGDINEHFYYNRNVAASVGGQHAAGDAIRIQPSPVTDRASVRLSWEVAQSVDCRILDMTGRCVMQWRMPSGQDQHRVVDMSALPAGSYVLQAAGAMSTQTLRFAITH